MEKSNPCRKKNGEKHFVSYFGNEVLYLFHFKDDFEQNTISTMESKNTMPLIDTGSAEKKHTILVAEDIDSNFALVDILLRKEFNIVRATNGNDAVRLFQEIRPSLILMDIQMPEMNGLEATKIIRKLDEEIPIVALTAFAFNSDRIEFLEAGGSDYVVKPIDPMQLKVMIKGILD